MLLFLMIIVAIVLFKLFLPQIKGWSGEKAVSALLATLPSEKYCVVNNVMLKTKEGTCQIDHIVVSIYGIFVIETKNYKGWIIGTEYANQWTKSMYGKKYSFRNPIKQNYGHVKTLEDYLGLSSETFIPIVAFSSGAELKINVKSYVIYIAQLPQVIQRHNAVKLKKYEVDTIVNRITNVNISNKEERKEHVQSIRTNLAIERQKISEGICPKCNGRLVKRKSKYGVFWGCSNYPKCRYTRK